MVHGTCTPDQCQDDDGASGHGTQVADHNREVLWFRSGDLVRSADFFAAATLSVWFPAWSKGGCGPVKAVTLTGAASAVRTWPCSAPRWRLRSWLPLVVPGQQAKGAKPRSKHSSTDVSSSRLRCHSTVGQVITRGDP